MQDKFLIFKNRRQGYNSNLSQTIIISDFSKLTGSVTIISAQEKQQKTDTKEVSKHEEYDGSKTHADVLHVLYVFDMFQREIARVTFCRKQRF